MSTKQPPAPAPAPKPSMLLWGTLLVALLIALFGRPLPSIAAAVIVIVMTTDPLSGRRLLKMLLRWPTP